MALLSKDQIWQADDILFEDVAVPEWGGEVRVRGLQGDERDAFEAASLTRGKNGARDINMKNLRARLVVACAIDAEARPLFTQADVIHLGKKSAVALERVFAVAQKLSGMTESDIEELAGNSEPGQNGSSTSA